MSTSHMFCLMFFIIRIWRKEKHLEECPVHFFSTHFYPWLLEEGGLKRVSSWTAQKNIDVFRKKWIFIPINHADTHWSLCCVVNPGFILNSVEALKKDPRDDEPYPCILYFDSMRGHAKETLVLNVQKWLNSEWTRLDKATNRNESKPFNDSSLPVHNPKGE